MKAPLSLLVLAFVAVGCSGGDGDSGDVAAANKAAAEAPKSVDQLPSTMTPEQKAVAEAGMGAQKAMTDQMNSQGAAMKRAQAGAH